MINVNDITKLINSAGGSVNVKINAHASLPGSTKSRSIQWEIIPVENTDWVLVNDNKLTNSLKDSGDKTVVFSATQNTNTYREAKFKFKSKLYSNTIEEADIIIQQNVEEIQREFDHYTAKNVTWSSDKSSVAKGRSITITATYDIYSVYKDEYESLTASGRTTSVTIYPSETGKYPKTDVKDNTYNNCIIGKEGCDITVTDKEIDDIDITDIGTSATPQLVESGGQSEIRIHYNWRYKYSDGTYGDKQYAYVSDTISNITASNGYGITKVVTHGGYTKTISGTVSIYLPEKATTIFKTDKSTLAFPSGGGSKQIDIFAYIRKTNDAIEEYIDTPLDWTITVPSGVTVDKSSGNGNSSVTVTVDENETNNEISSEMVINSGDKSIKVRIEQEALIIHNYHINLTSDYSNIEYQDNSYHNYVSIDENEDNISCMLYDNDTYIKDLELGVDIDGNEFDSSWLTLDSENKIKWTQSDETRTNKIQFVLRDDSSIKVDYVVHQIKFESDIISGSTQIPSSNAQSLIFSATTNSDDDSNISITTDVDWIHITKVGSNNVASFDNNTNYTSRTGKITVNYHNIKKTYNITQKGTATLEFKSEVPVVNGIRTITIPVEGTSSYTGIGKVSKDSYFHFNELVNASPSTSKLYYKSDNSFFAAVGFTSYDKDPWIYLSNYSRNNIDNYNVTITQKIDDVEVNTLKLRITQLSE